MISADPMSTEMRDLEMAAAILDRMLAQIDAEGSL